MSVCGDKGPEPDVCELAPRHEGFHKSSMHAWPNTAESLDRWAAVGRRLLGGVSMPWLSRLELEYAVDAAKRTGQSRCLPGEYHSHEWIEIRTLGPGPDEPRLVDRYCDLCKKRPLDVLAERQIVPE